MSREYIIDGFATEVVAPKNEDIDILLADAYHIRYNTRKAIYAYNQLQNLVSGSGNEDDCFYCHIYVDMLFQACGMINKRFWNIKDRPDGENLLGEYEFSKENYPILSSMIKDRNHIEHIDEREYIQFHRDVLRGTFNVVFPDMNQEIKAALLSEQKPISNILNLEDMTYTIIEPCRKGGPLVTKKTELCKLYEEIEKLSVKSNLVWEKRVSQKTGEPYDHHHHQNQRLGNLAR